MENLEEKLFKYLGNVVNLTAVQLNFQGYFQIMFNVWSEWIFNRF